MRVALLIVAVGLMSGCILPTQPRPVVTQFSVSPPVFDALRDRAVMIRYTLSHLAAVSIGIYTTEDSLVKVIASRRQAVKGMNTAIWVGDTNSAGFAEAGVYIVRLVVHGGEEAVEASVNVFYF